MLRPVFTFDIAEYETWPPACVMRIDAEKRWVVEGSVDGKDYLKLVRGEKSEMLDLVPDIRFYRVRKYGRHARIRDPLYARVYGKKREK